MINSGKITTRFYPEQIAGLMPNDSNIEFVGKQNTMQVLWLQNGRTLEWKDLPRWAYNICKKHYITDRKAVSYFEGFNVDLDRQVEMYIYHLYGDLDATADILKGKIQTSENFRHTTDCFSIDLDHKRITIDCVPLTKRDLKIIDFTKAGLPDKAIASELGITQSTLDFHKRNLFEKTGVQCKTELIIKALNQHI
jgi:DNA-binding CsgD family transcriptional regulator